MGLLPHHQNPNPNIKRPGVVGEYFYNVFTLERIEGMDVWQSIEYCIIRNYLIKNPETPYFIRSNVKSLVKVRDTVDKYQFCSGFGRTPEEALEYVELRIRDSNNIDESKFRGVQTTLLITEIGTIKMSFYQFGNGEVVKIKS